MNRFFKAFLALVAGICLITMGCRSIAGGPDNEPMRELPKQAATPGPDVEDPQIYNLSVRSTVANVTSYVDVGRGETVLAQYVILDGDSVIFEAYGQLVAPDEDVCVGELNGTLLNSEEFSRAYPGPKVVVVDVRGRKLETLNVNTADGELSRDTSGRLDTDRLRFVRTQRINPLGVRVEDGSTRYHFRLPSGAMVTIFPIGQLYGLMQNNTQTFSIWGTYEDGRPTSIGAGCTSGRRIRMDNGTVATAADWYWHQSNGSVKVFPVRRQDGTFQFATVNLDLIEERPQEEDAQP